MTQRLPTPGGDDGDWGTILNGFLGVSLNSDGSLNASATITALGAAATSVSFNGQKITNIANGTASTDAAAFGQIPTSLPPNGSAGGDLTGSYPNPTLSGTSNVESIISANTTVTGALQKSNNLSDISNAGSARANIAVPMMTPAMAAATSNVSISSSPSSFDGFSPSSGDYVFLAFQSTTSQNGLWKFNGSGSALTRPTEFPSGGSTKGRTVVVMNGTSYANTTWTLDLAAGGSVTIDTTAQTWIQMTFPVGYYKWLTSTTNIILSAGTYKISLIGGGCGGGGSAAGLASYTCTLTSVRKPTASSLEFPSLGSGSTTEVVAGMTVTGTGITAPVNVQSVRGDVVNLVAGSGGSIGTLSAASAYVFVWPNSGGGGATANNCTFTVVSDGQTPFNASIGAGGLGVSGSNGNAGGTTTFVGGIVASTTFTGTSGTALSSLSTLSLQSVTGFYARGPFSCGTIMCSDGLHTFTWGAVNTSTNQLLSCAFSGSQSATVSSGAAIVQGYCLQAPSGGYGTACSSTQLGYAGVPGGPFITNPSNYSAFYFIGAAGSLLFAGLPSYLAGLAGSEDAFGCVGGGAGASISGSNGGSGGHAGFPIGDGVGGVLISAGDTSTSTSTGGVGGNALANSGCGGGGAGSSNTGGSAVVGGSGGSGWVEARRVQ